MTRNYTVADIREIIESNIEDTALADKVAKVLERFDGKTITKRLANAVEKALPEFTVFYDTGAGMKHIDIWGGGLPHSERKRFLLTYDSHSQVFSFERFTEEYNKAYYGAAQERNAKRAEKLKDIAWQMQVVAAINAINSNVSVLRGLIGYPTPDRHDLAKLVEAL